MSWLDNLIKTNSVQKYAYIIKRFQDADDISADKLFQKRYNGFFRIRRNPEWQRQYYAMIQHYKQTNTVPDYKTILQELYKRTNRVEKSFASKALHILNHDLPILDSVVLGNFNLQTRLGSNCSPQARLAEVCDIYERLKNKIYEYRDSDEGEQRIKEFRAFVESLPANEDFDKDIARNISDTKIIDFYFWSK